MTSACGLSRPAGQMQTWCSILLAVHILVVTPLLDSELARSVLERELKLTVALAESNHRNVVLMTEVVSVASGHWGMVPLKATSMQRSLFSSWLLSR